MGIKGMLKIQENEKYFYFFIIGLTMLRALTMKIRPCPLDFDCNAYIAMSSNLLNPDIPGHHAMRLLPSMMAGILHNMGLSLATAFRLLSDSMYVVFGAGVYWSLRQSKVNPWIALGFTLLCLAPHSAMRIPLQLVYQTCDMMTYPLSLFMIYFSCKEQGRWVFALSLIGIITKQNLFILGELSLLYCLINTRHWENGLYVVILAALYGFLQSYFQATSTFVALLQPPADFYSFSHLLWLIQDSKILELIIPIIPLIIWYCKPLCIFLLRNWHIGMYVGIVVVQPLVGYHLTGNNLPRLALQGIWIVFLVLGIVSTQRPWTKLMTILFVVYAVSLYFTWAVPERIILMTVFSVLAVASMIFKERLDHSLKARLKIANFRS